MSRYKSYGEPAPEEVETLYKTVSVQGRFKDFLEKHRAFLETASVREILYKTQWAQKGHDEPESVIAWMETVGFYSAPAETKTPAKDGGKEDDKDVINVRADEEAPEEGVQEAAFV